MAIAIVSCYDANALRRRWHGGRSRLNSPLLTQTSSYALLAGCPLLLRKSRLSWNRWRLAMTKWFFVALFATAIAVPAGAVTRNVPADYPTIQAALNASTAVDVIRVAPGTYVESLVI